MPSLYGVLPLDNTELAMADELHKYYEKGCMQD